MSRILPHYARPIKSETIEEIHRWVDFGTPPGDFVTAILLNDLKETCATADADNILVIPLIVKYLYNSCPAACWGNAERLRDWHMKGGLRGQ